MTTRVVAAVGAGDGFSASARQRIEAAVDSAQDHAGIAFSVVVGRSEGDSQVHARRLLAQVTDPQNPHVLFFISPAQRFVEVVTNAAAHQQVSDEACSLAVLSMTTSFSVGDLPGGIVTGLRMVSDAARRAS